MKTRISEYGKRIRSLIQYNWKTLLGFEALFKTVSAVVFAPLLAGLFHGIMDVTGYPYLTLDNVDNFLENPLTILSLILLAVLAAAYFVIDVGAVIFVLDQSWQKNRVSLVQTLRFSLENAVRILKRKNMLLALLILLLIPFLNIGVLFSFLTTVSIPSFVRTFLRRNRELVTLAGAMALIGGTFLLYLIYAFHYFMLERCDFRESLKRSRRLSRRHRWKDAAALLIVQVFFHLNYFLFAAVGILLVALFNRAFANIHLLQSVTTSAVWGLLMVTLFLVSALGTPVSYACISILYYLRKEQNKEAVLHSEAQPEPQGKKHRKRVRIAEGMLAAAAVCGGAFLVYQNSSQRSGLPVEYLRTTEVTAHRGASRQFPENTMAAFEGAVELGADWIELDVQQSRDGQIFVMHDPNFLRTAGVDKYSWEMDYWEIAALDAGSKFGYLYAGQRIPLLSEVLAFAGEKDIRLNIELKPTGRETDFEKSVVDLIREAGLEERCVVTSQSYPVLERVKEYDPEITTIYVMGLAYGKINRLEAADGFSVEAASVTPALVARVHNAGKPILAWTVNSPRTMRRMVDLKVDNIITDNVEAARQCIYESKTSGIIQEYLDFLLG